MGVYLVVIGIADRLFTGSYLWNEYRWRHSAACSLAGFLTLLSCEVSTLVMCLITLDRFLVLRNSLWSALCSRGVACRLVRGAGSGDDPAAARHLPLAVLQPDRHLYPITKTDFPGQPFSFAVIIVLNFVLFLCVSEGQVIIYWSVQANSMSTFTVML
jgi:hypothetical protein